jgi:hypothetical protein
MTSVLPALKQVPSPNCSSRGGARVRLVVVHDTEGAYAGAVSWFTQVRSQVSAHLVMREDGGEVTQMVPLGEKAWHACNANPYSIGIEGAGVGAHGFADAWWAGMAIIVAWLLRRYGLPCRWAADGVGEGFCSHHDLGPVGGGHEDPCAVGSSEWTRFIGLVEAAYAAFGDAPLPDWALHGLPAPSIVTLPPAAAAGETSHAGAPGVEPDNAARYAFVTQFPTASVADIQRRLNQAGASPALAVDGLGGAMTRAAIMDFQRLHGLAVDGEVGPLTWAALEKTTA